MNYLLYMRNINPIAEKIVNRYLSDKNQRLSGEWCKNFNLISPIVLPEGFWDEDSISSKGIDSFYLRDQYSEDARNLLSSYYNLPCDKDAIVKARLFGEYFFAPELSPEARYITKLWNQNTLEIKTDSLKDTWVYLPAKEKQPSVYALDFNFVSYTETKETLQIDFLMNTLPIDTDS